MLDYQQMNMKLLTKVITSTALAAVTASFFTSCATQDPEYVEWKRQKQAQAAQTADANNPFAVPGLNGETGTPQLPNITGNAPYQPLPGVPNDPPVIPEPDIAPNVSFPSNNNQANIPSGASVSHTVVPGDSLWALARKHKTTVAAIKASNNLTSDNIWVGQKLTIESN